MARGGQRGRSQVLLFSGNEKGGGGGGGDGERGRMREGDRDRKMWGRESDVLSLCTRPALLSVSVSVAVALSRAICPTSG